MSHPARGRRLKVLDGLRKARGLLLAVILASSPIAAQTGPEAIHQAARDGDAVKIKSLLDTTPGLVNVKDGSGRTPLISAAFASRAEPSESSPYLAGVGEYGEKLQADYLKPVEAAKALLAAGAAVDARDNEDYTALHWAALRGNKALVSVLVAAGAAVGAVDKTYRATPLHLAVRAGHLAAAGALIDAGADPRVKDAYSRTPLDYAKSSGNAELVKRLGRRPRR
jgi:cytohesin